MKVAFVVQRCGEEVNGGAERHCLHVAQRMSKYWETEVLTTCALAYMRWENFYPPALQQIHGTVVRRFPVDQPRDVQEFDRISGRLRLRKGEATLEEQERWMRAQGPISTALLDHIAQQKENYDAFIFFGYLYAPTYFGLPLVQDKAFLVPLAHDEWPIYLPMWEPFFSRPRGFIFNTLTEQQFLRRRFVTLRLEGPAIGVGIEPPAEVRPLAFRERYELFAPFLLYAGRIDGSKGCGRLFDYFLRARAKGAFDHKLVLLGEEVMPIPFDDAIIHLGFVSDGDKWNAMAACDWLLIPSAFESLSMVLLETWSVGRPAMVNARSDVLTAHCRAGNGGLWHSNFEEWKTGLSWVSPRVKDALGRNGREYVKKHYSWARVEKDYLAAIGGL